MDYNKSVEKVEPEEYDPEHMENFKNALKKNPKYREVSIYELLYTIILLLIFLVFMVLIVKNSWNYTIPSLFPTLNIQELTNEKALVLLILVRFLFGN